jgi:hypothetical protein
LDIKTTTSQRIEDHNWRGFESVRKLSENFSINIGYYEELYFTSFGEKFIKICVIDKNNLVSFNNNNL